MLGSLLGGIAKGYTADKKSQKEQQALLDKEERAARKQEKADEIERALKTDMVKLKDKLSNEEVVRVEKRKEGKNLEKRKRIATTYGLDPDSPVVYQLSNIEADDRVKYEIEEGKLIKKKEPPKYSKDLTYVNEETGATVIYQVKDDGTLIPRTNVSPLESKESKEHKRKERERAAIRARIALQYDVPDNILAVYQMASLSMKDRLNYKIENGKVVEKKPTPEFKELITHWDEESQSNVVSKLDTDGNLTRLDKVLPKRDDVKINALKEKTKVFYDQYSNPKLYPEFANLSLDQIQRISFDVASKVDNLDKQGVSYNLRDLALSSLNENKGKGEGIFTSTKGTYEERSQQKTDELKKEEEEEKLADYGREQEGREELQKERLTAREEENKRERFNRDSKDLSSKYETIFKGTEPALEQVEEVFGKFLISKGVDTMDIPGYGIIEGFIPDQIYGVLAELGDDRSKEAIGLRETLASLFNRELKIRSGAAVTTNELNRLMTEFGIGGGRGDMNIARGLKRYRAILNRQKALLFAGYEDEVIEAWSQKQGVSVPNLLTIQWARETNKRRSKGEKPKALSLEQIMKSAKEMGWSDSKTKKALKTYGY